MLTGDEHTYLIHHLNNDAEPGLRHQKTNCVFLIYWTLHIQALSAESFLPVCQDSLTFEDNYWNCFQENVVCSCQLHPDLYSSQSMLLPLVLCGCCSITLEDATELCCRQLLPCNGGRPTCDAHLLEKIRTPGVASQDWFPLWCFIGLSDQTPGGCLKRLYYPTMSCPSFFDASARDLLTKGSPPLCATGERAEMKREHKGPSEVLPSPVHTLCVALALVACMWAHHVFLHLQAYFAVPQKGREVFTKIHSTWNDEWVCSNTESTIF